eukprot:Gb_41393 [translate_table: standard]
MANRGLSVVLAGPELVLLSRSAIHRRRSWRRHLPHCLCVFRASHSTRLSPNAPDLMQWIRHEGGFVHQGLRLDDGGPSGLGLVSSQTISAGTEIISLPRHIPLALPPLDSAPDHPDAVLIDLARRLPEELWTLRLGLKLLGERAKVGSFWWPYISNLPESFNVPIFFSKQEIQGLQYIPVIHQVSKRCKLLFDFEAVVNSTCEKMSAEQHPFRGQYVDAASLGWAMSAVSTRAFRLRGDIMSDGKRGGTPMLLPLIDMCNHNFHPNSRIVQETDSCGDKFIIKVVTEEQIEEDAPILLNYGSLTNDLLLLDYGFVVPKNTHDFIELKYDMLLLDAATMAAGLQSAAFASPAPWQQEILTKLKLQGHQAVTKVIVGGADLVDGRLLAALRILFAEDLESVQKHDLTTLQLLNVEAPLGVANESNVLRTVIAICAIALGHFPTNFMEDEMILKKEGNSKAMKLAVEFRIRKKELLIDVMKDLTRRLNLLRKLINKDGATMID